MHVRKAGGIVCPGDFAKLEQGNISFDLFDQHHEKSDRIYRVIRKIKDVALGSGELSATTWGQSPSPLICAHENGNGKFPEVEAVTRLLFNARQGMLLAVLYVGI